MITTTELILTIGVLLVSFGMFGLLFSQLIELFRNLFKKDDEL
jgi:hypothetical protein